MGQCRAITNQGTRCSREALTGSAYCGIPQHHKLHRQKITSDISSRSHHSSLLSSSKKLVVNISGSTPSLASKLSRYLTFTGETQGFYSYTLTNEEEASKLSELLTQATESVASYQTSSGRITNVPLNLYGDVSRISGPISLSTINVEGRLYHFFGDNHGSNEGLCSEPSYELYPILDRISKSSDGPSIDVFAEISRDYLIGEGNNGTPFPRFLTDAYKCISKGPDDSGKYSQDFTTQCGLNMRYHGSDIRKQVPEAFLFRFGENRYLEMNDLSQVDISLMNTVNILTSISSLRNFLKGFVVPGDSYTPEIAAQAYEMFLDVYETNQTAKTKIDGITLDILGLPRPYFESVFTTGTIDSIPSSLSVYTSMIKKQVDNCDPEKVRDIFTFISKNFAKTIIQKAGSTEYKNLVILLFLRKKAISDPRYILGFDEDIAEEDPYLFIAGNIEKKDPTLQTFYQELLRIMKPENASLIEEFIEKLILDRKIEFYHHYSRFLKLKGESNSEIFEKILTLAATCLSSFPDLVIVMPFYAGYMDLYTLLRIERNYLEPRSLKDSEGMLIPESEYYRRRPKKTECVVVYAGAFHANNYTNYFFQKEGSEIIEYTSMPGFRNVDKLLESDVDITNRCLDIARPLSSLWIPYFPTTETIYVSSTPLF